MFVFSRCNTKWLQSKQNMDSSAYTHVLYIYTHKSKLEDRHAERNANAKDIHIPSIFFLSETKQTQHMEKRKNGTVTLSGLLYQNCRWPLHFIHLFPDSLFSCCFLSQKISYKNIKILEEGREHWSPAVGGGEGGGGCTEGAGEGVTQAVVEGGSTGWKEGRESVATTQPPPFT